MKYLKNYNTYNLNEANDSQDLSQVVSDVNSNIKQFNKEYKDFLNVIKKINKKEKGQQDIFKAKIVEQFSKFLEKYKITDKVAFDNFVKDSLVKDRNAITLHKDFSEESKFLENVAKVYFDTLKSGKSTTDAIATSTKVEQPKATTDVKPTILTQNSINDDDKKYLSNSKTLDILGLNRKCDASQVKILQRFLNVESNGTFNEATEIAVKKYQESKKITSDGVVGKNTWASILADLGISTNAIIGKANTTKSISKVNSIDYDKQANDAITSIVKERGLKNSKTVTTLELEEKLKKIFPNYKPNDDFKNIYDFYNYYAIQPFEDFSEPEWLKYFTSLTTDELKKFVTEYNKNSKFYKIKPDNYFLGASKQGFDGTDWNSFVKVFKDKGLEISDSMMNGVVDGIYK